MKPLIIADVEKILENERALRSLKALISWITKNMTDMETVKEALYNLKQLPGS